MEMLVAECLRCGCTRPADATNGRPAADECPRCGYVGWAETSELSEPVRRLLRERPLEQRRLLRIA